MEIFNNFVKTFQSYGSKLDQKELSLSEDTCKLHHDAHGKGLLKHCQTHFRPCIGYSLPTTLAMSEWFLNFLQSQAGAAHLAGKRLKNY
jgi:hypothetical protein